MKTCVILMLTSLAMVGSGLAQVMEVPGLEVQSAYASIKRNKDGTKEEFTRTAGDTTITKKTRSADGKTLLYTTVYRLDQSGNPINSDIFDGLGNRIFKTRYGYSKKDGITFGKLIFEDMFDARAKRIDPATNKEMPVRRFTYTYDAQGNPLKPICTTLIPGKTYEQVFGGPSGLQFDPFQGKKLPANPNAEPVRGTGQ
jgi:hypothetical protein